MKHALLQVILALNDWIKTVKWLDQDWNKIVVATVKKATLKYFIILKKETVENAMTFDKVVIFRYNKNKDWFSHETGLVFKYGEVCKGAFKNCHILRWSSMQKLEC